MEKYTIHSVERLLRKYVDIRVLLIDRSFVGSDVMYTMPPEDLREISNNVFGTKPNASKVRDGKRTARATEELHCSSLDLEIGFNKLRPDEQYTLYHYYIVNDMTFDELARKLDLADRSVAKNKATRALRKLTEYMQGGEKDDGTSRNT